MPKTLLAVDDSATMRKVLEITFGGDDFHVISAATRDQAMEKMRESPSVVVVDTMLDGADGYALAKEIRQRDASVTLILLASRHNPYDSVRGKDAGADDFMDKPFDTQQMIDKVRKAVLAREAMAPKAPPQPVRPPSRESVTAVTGITHPPATAPSVGPVPPRAPPAPGSGFQRAAISPGAPRTTLSFESQQNVAPPPHAASAAHPVVTTGFGGSHESTQPAQAASMISEVNGNGSAAVAMGGRTPGTVASLPAKLSDLGLTSAQVEAVMALSREVVERVVWEVVPQLAETMIREEIARLMRE